MSRVVEYLFGMDVDELERYARLVKADGFTDGSINADHLLELVAVARELAELKSESASRSTVDTRDGWAVAVLDAWAEQNGLRSWRASNDGNDRRVTLYERGMQERETPAWFAAPALPMARLKAAQAVYASLPASIRAELGECPNGEPDNDLREFGCCPGDSAAELKSESASRSTVGSRDRERDPVSRAEHEAALESHKERLAELEQRLERRSTLKWASLSAQLTEAETKLTEQQAEHEREVTELRKMLTAANRATNESSFTTGGCEHAFNCAASGARVLLAFIEALNDARKVSRQ